MSEPVVTVTGGATGVGAAVVDQLLERDAVVHVLDVADVTPRERVTFTQCDLADPSSIDAALAALPSQIDAHINVAGVAGPTPADWVLKVNFLGLRHLTESLFDRLSAGGGVVSVSSSAGPGRPRLLPILWTLPRISLQYFCPWPMWSMISRAAMEISAVSMP